MAQPPRSSATSSIPKAAPSAKKVVVVNDTPLFGKMNLWLMIAGGIIIILGMIIMAGGRSSDPKVFAYDEVYSKTRITLAPILIIIGILVEIVAIFFQGRNATADKEPLTV
jgi:nitrate reductase gamma subunit